MPSPKVIESRKIYSGSFSLIRDTFKLDKKLIEKEIVVHQPSIGLIPIINNDVVLVTQYRHPARKSILEIPAGKIEKGETPEQAAYREIEEETGYSAGRLKHLFNWYLAPGYNTELIRIFLATGLKKRVGSRDLDEDENICVKRMKLDSAVRKCLEGDVVDCKTVAAMLCYRDLVARADLRLGRNKPSLSPRQSEP